MPSVFKYLPTQYSDALLDGAILFRNLVYFKRIEADPRADVYEGLHVDAPDHDVTITNLTTGNVIKGQFAFHNSLTHMDRVYCFCTSLNQTTDLCSKFGDACIEVRDVDEFSQRVLRSLRKRHSLTRLDEPILLARQVAYYSANREAPPSMNIKEPRDLPFLKRDDYKDEAEFRFVFARKGGYKLTQRVVNSRYFELDTIRHLNDKQVLLQIGSIRDIAARVP